MLTSSSFAPQKYDVFVSFRGEDVRKTFLSHLYHQFARKRIVIFKDEEFARKGIKTFKDEEVESRKQVPASVLRAISDTKVKVLLLSKKYSASSWCLDELVEILKVQSMVVPVYYEVDLSDVRYQTGEFGQDFQRHCKVENQEKLQSWRNALTRLTDIKPGFSSQAVKDDSKLIRQITLCVSDLLSNSCFHKELLPREIQIDKSTTKKASLSHLVSDQIMDRHMKVIYGLLDLESTSQVRLSAISGIVGVGKTTIARHLYQELSSAFHYHYFLENSSNIFLHISETQGISNTSIMRSYKNLTPPFQDHCCLHETSRNFHDQGLVRDTSSSSSQENNLSPRGLKRKAMQALCSDLGSDDQKKARLCHERVLVVVDNIETIEQLEEIMKDVNLFGPGSRIIVITQDKSLLLKCGVKHVYEVDCLNYDEALELFSQCAFKMQYPPANFEQLSVHAVSVAGFLPLGLKLLGSFLYGRTKEDWVNELERLELKQDKVNQKSLAHDVPLMAKPKRIGM